MPLIFPVQFVHDTDLERFSEKLAEAIAEYSAASGEPRITFSHAATDDGFDYVALLIAGQSDTTPRIRQ